MEYFLPHKLNLPHIIVAGRPNVGKSTLFNRLIKQRFAITSPIPGVTRDVIQTILTLPSKISCILEDSPGYCQRIHDELQKNYQQNTFNALKSANLILFMTEISGLNEDDYSIIQQIRKIQTPTLLIVNKVDTPECDYDTEDFWKLGLGQPLAISAEHNRNISLLVKTIEETILSFSNIEDYTVKSQKILTKIGVFGRPNVGKSTLVNTICQQTKNLVSPLPGTTRDIVKSFFRDQDDIFEIIDTAGLKRQSKIGESLEFYASQRVEKAIEICDIALLLIDITQGLTEQDKKIASKIAKQKKPMLFVLTKIDLKDKKTVIKKPSHFYDIVSEDIDRMRAKFPILGYVPVVPVSSFKEETLRELLKQLRILHEKANLRVSDVDLQLALGRWCAYKQPLNRKGRHAAGQVWLKSLRQVAVCPPRFILKVRGEITADYLRYIANSLRKEFCFFCVPIDIKVSHIH